MTRHASLFAIALLVLLCGAETARAYNPPIFIKRWGTFGSTPGQLNAPRGVACDAAGNVYVMDTFNSRVQKFDNNGTSPTQWGTAGSGDGQFNNARYLTVDASGNVFVSDFWNSRIQKFSSTGTFLGKWGSPGNGEGQFNQPYGVATDAAGNVYVSDAENHRIQKFTGTGDFLAQWQADTSGVPRGLAVGPNGHIYAVIHSSSAVVYHPPFSEVEEFTNSGAVVRRWGMSGVDDSDFVDVIGIATDASGRVFVTDAGRWVKVFTSEGVYIGKFGSFGTGKGQFTQAYGISVDAAGSVFVVDMYDNRVNKFGGTSSWFAPALDYVSWSLWGDRMRFHLGFDNPNTQGPSLPLSGTLFPQPFGAFLPSLPVPIAGFSVPPLPPSSHFDIFADIPFDGLPPTAPMMLPGDGPGPADPCSPIGWSGNVDVSWDEAEGPAHSIWSGGELPVAPGAANSFVHLISGCIPTTASDWAIVGGCPGFTATLLEENRVTPAPPLLPPAWHGFLAVSADPGIVPGTVCQFDVLFDCDDASALIEVSARACAWATADVADAGGRRGFGIVGIAPNPVRRSAAIRFTTAHAGRATLDVFDLAGHRVRTLLDDVVPAGAHIESWDGTGARGERVRAGMYFVRLRQLDRMDRRTAVLIE